jgi:hypothetical protein
MDAADYLGAAVVVLASCAGIRVGVLVRRYRLMATILLVDILGIHIGEVWWSLVPLALVKSWISSGRGAVQDHAALPELYAATGRQEEAAHRAGCSGRGCWRNALLV